MLFRSVTLITLGLFLFVINALMFYFAAHVLSGFNVTGFGAALVGSLIYSLCGMVIDVALERERGEGLEPSVAIHQAALLRFRPILMTTMAAILGALPLAIGIREQADSGCPTVVADPDGEIAGIYKTVARQVAVKIAEKAKDFSSKFPTIKVSKDT